jgi:hypothetical protein
MALSESDEINHRWANALASLQGAYRHMLDTVVDAEEVRSRNRLIALCKRIAEDYKDSPI